MTYLSDAGGVLGMSCLLSKMMIVSPKAPDINTYMPQDNSYIVSRLKMALVFYNGERSLKVVFSMLLLYQSSK